MPDTSQQNIILHFKGQLDYDKISDLIQDLKEDMKNRGVRFGIYKKVLTLMIESLENVIRYRENQIKEVEILSKYPPEFTISHCNDEYVLEVSNPVYKKDSRVLNNRLNQLNSLDKKEIKELYKATITNGQFSEYGGAGLGMIEMAKLSDKKLDFSFTEIDSMFSEFRLKITLKSTLQKKPG